MEPEQDTLKDKLIIGIDLGTTKSGVAVWDDRVGRVMMCPDSETGDLTTPSVVAWNRTRQEWLVGHPARAILEQRPADVVHSIKRYIGRWFVDPQIMRGQQNLTYKLISGGGVDALRDVLVDFGTADNSPPPQTAPEISSKVLAKLRRDAAHYLGLPLEEVKYAVITVPAYFNVLQRRATILAGKLAELEVVDILNEPTAAALSYSQVIFDPNKLVDEHTILVYDLGGGTFDISLLETRHDEMGYEFFTRVVDGDTRLGGNDIDNAVADWLRREIEKRHDRSVRPDDQLTRARLLLAAERAKIALSDAATTTIELPNLDFGDSSPFGARVELTRDQLTACAEKVLSDTEMITRRAVIDVAELPWDQIDQVIMVGGQTLTPVIQESVRQLTGHEPRFNDRPQLVVAQGAGEYAHILSRGRDRFHQNALINVIALPLGIRLDENTFQRLVDANVTVPYRNQPYPIRTTEDDQRFIHVEVLQGPRNATLASQCVVLGSIDMDILPAPAGTTKFEAILDVRSDGTMTVIVTDKRTNKSVTKDIIEARLVLREQEPPQGGQKP